MAQIASDAASGVFLLVLDGLIGESSSGGLKKVDSVVPVNTP